jgi:hypothetical protein
MKIIFKCFEYIYLWEAFTGVRMKIISLNNTFEYIYLWEAFTGVRMKIIP